MLVGIQGSGKSEIAKQLEQKGYFVASNDRYCTVKEGNFVLEYNFVKKSFFVRIIAHLFIIMEGKKNFFA